MSIAPFVHLRNHTAYSVAEGALTSDKIRDLCRKYNMPAAGITDTNNIFGGAEFSTHLEEVGVQPILGTQLDVDFDLPQVSFPKDRYSQLIFLVQNSVGYHNLIKLISYAHLRKKDTEYPHITLDMFEGKTDGLIVLSGGTKGVIGKCLLANNFDLAEEKCLILKKLFGDRFYIELQRHGLPEEKKTEADFLKLAYKHNIPLVATNECFFATRDMYQAHDVLLCIAEGRFVDEEDRRKETEEHYFKTPDEMVELFSDLPEAIENTIEIAKRCAYKFTVSEPLLPHVEKGEHFTIDENFASQIPSIKALAEKTEASLKKFWNNFKEDKRTSYQNIIDDTINIISNPNTPLDEIKKKIDIFTQTAMKLSEAELLTKRAHEGLKVRLEKAEIIGEEAQKPYWERLEYELSVIIGMGFPGYFLIVADFIGWAKEHDIPVGPGRGSGAGSIVAWAMKITDLNPLRFGLLFERFLNPERVNMPDFDIDFCEDRRGEVIHYVQEKYGADSVGQIITFGQLKAKNAIKDVGRVLRIGYSRCDELCKLIPTKVRFQNDKGEEIEKEANLTLCLKYVPEFAEAVDHDDVLKGLINIALKIEGLFKSTGMHAAGVVIGDRPLDELVALYKTDKSDWPVTQYNMKFIENTGLIKYDFLGLKTLTVIKKACDMIYQNHGVKIDINNVSMDDKPTYELLQATNTPAIFQLESQGMQNVILGLKPDKIEDLVALVALYRPGPMDNIPTYIARKFGEKIEYLHPKLEPILKETYGIMVYQEQVMEIGKQLAGYTKGMADDLRKAMGKKIKEKMDHHREIFKEGCLKVSGIEETLSMKIFDAMAQFASYGFNKSHAVCYAWVCYQTAYLKTHYAPEFMASSMTYDMTDTDKLAFFADNVKKMGIKILRPDINKSYEYFSVENGAIRYAMAAIKNVGVGVVQAIVAEREKNGPFKNITDFISRVDPKNLNKRMLENLIKAGAFDDLEPNRHKMFDNVNYIISQIASINKDKETNQTSLFSLDEIEVKRDDIRLSEVPEWKPLERLGFEKEVIGFYVSAHPLDVYENSLIALNAKSSTDVALIKENTKICVAGIVEAAHLRTSKTGKNYIMAKISDKTGIVDVLFFERKPSNYNPKFSKQEPRQSLEDIQTILQSGKPILIYADTKCGDDGKVTLFGNKVEYLTLNTQLGTNMFIQIDSVDAVRSVKKALSSIPPGYTTIHLQVIENGKKVSILLPEKKGMTTETLEMFKVIPNIVIHF